MSEGQTANGASYEAFTCCLKGKRYVFETLSYPTEHFSISGATGRGIPSEHHTFLESCARLPIAKGG
jgi:hypothetical protein